MTFDTIRQTAASDKAWDGCLAVVKGYHQPNDGRGGLFFGTPPVRKHPTVRRGGKILMDLNYDGQHDKEQIYDHGTKK